MSRLGVAVRNDFLLQWRFGFFVVGVFVAAFAIAVLWLIVSAEMAFAIPTFVLGNLLTTTFLFVAAMVMFEKGEGTIEAIVVSPLRVGEYLGSKVFTLTTLAVVETLAIVLAVYPGSLGMLALVTGTTVTAATFVLYGFVVASRYDSITDFLFPGILCLSVSQVPAIGSLGIWDPWLLYVFPTRAMLIWVEAAIRPVSAAEWSYAIGYSALTAAILYVLARRSFERFVVRKHGVR